MEFIKKYSTILVAAATILVAFGVYIFLRGDDVPVDPALLYTSDASNQIAMGVGQDILVALEELRRLKLNIDIFNDPSFQSLVDFASATTSEPLGRPDPFESLPDIEE